MKKSVLDKVTDQAWIRTRLEYWLLGTWYRNFVENDGRAIMEADWDTLLILDACRYDTLAEMAPKTWPEVERTRSKASNTWNFYRRNFQRGPYNDTVVITAQPRTVQLRGDAFHRVIPVYEDDWDEELGTLPPDVMAKRTIEAHRRFPDKRVLAHWVQPHYPFIGSESLPQYKGSEESIWQDLKRGQIELSDEDIYRAYEETLRITLPHVSDVISEVTGKVVVSSDHGNVFGEKKFPYPFKIYGHPRDVRIPKLVNVPWVTFENGSRRSIHTEYSEHESTVSEDVNERLSELGYLQ